MTIRTTLTTLLLLTLLSGCSSLLPKPEGGKQNLQSSLNRLQQWQVRGKLSVTSPDDSVTGYLTWEQDKQSYNLFISGPFGSGSSRLQGNARQAELTLPGWDKPQRARTPEQLMLAHMGWNFPVTDIRYWVKGQASPNAAASSKYDKHGLLSHLQQHGWDIRFSRYQQHGRYWLPGLIKISGHDFRFVFSIKEWTVNG